ncbi:lasso RiPP family leader peptide-containing protein [Streptomyces chrestomyceticus]
MDKDIMVYESPAVTEAGDFTDVTLGYVHGALPDGGTPPYAWRANF